MKPNPFDNLPNLSKEEATKILRTPIDKLNLSSDYYKAVFHLYKYPGSETEKLLLSLVESNSDQHPIIIARRKAVEVLARLGCSDSIPAIGKCLRSDDSYLVENSAWALAQLSCKDSSLIHEIACLLDDPSQNRRVLVQSLTKLGAKSEFSRIKIFLGDQSAPPGVKGAAIAAAAKLLGETEQLYKLKDYLLLPRQNDRQCAVQDVIDSGSIELLPSALRSPVAPSFRLRAVEALWPEVISLEERIQLVDVIDALIIENPQDIDILEPYNKNLEIEVLIKELFSTDFAHAYLSLKNLMDFQPKDIWPVIVRYWERATKDYGALYFFMLLFNSISGWSEESTLDIEELALYCLGDQWPGYMKFRPLCIISLMHFNPLKYRNYVSDWLNPSNTSFWACRYAALMSIEPYLEEEGWSEWLLKVRESVKDPHRFVREKAQIILFNIN